MTAAALSPHLAERFARHLADLAAHGAGHGACPSAIDAGAPQGTASEPISMAVMEQAGLVVGHRLRTRIAEELRITMGELLRIMAARVPPGADPSPRVATNVAMLTSARPGEGKSFIALNLAGSIAQHAQRQVILIDVDAKAGSLSGKLGLADRAGLLDLGHAPGLRVEDALRRTALPLLSLLPVGRGPGAAPDAAPGVPAAALVERVARRFPEALVLIDAPPCLSTSDPSTLAPFVGHVVLVVQAEGTQRNEVAAALDLVKACPSVTLLLNKICLTTSYTFGAYHYFGTYS
jgi:protein-tyrosine kinase